MALTCVEMPDRMTKIGKEMTTALVDWNKQHFQQPIVNGATAADGGIFSRGLCLHNSSPEDLQQHTRTILAGKPLTSLECNRSEWRVSEP